MGMTPMTCSWGVCTPPRHAPQGLHLLLTCLTPRPDLHFARPDLPLPLPPPPAIAASSGAEQEAALDQSHPTSLLILVSACHMVLAVALTAYDEDIEELAGRCRPGSGATAIVCESMTENVADCQLCVTLGA